MRRPYESARPEPLPIKRLTCAGVIVAAVLAAAVWSLLTGL